MATELRVGVTPWLMGADDARSLARQAGLAESLGFHSFWLPESHFTGPGSRPAPLLQLAAVAASTTRLRLGTTSFLVPLRHPLHVAAEVAVLDHLSQGRVILGLGRGFRSATFTAFGVPEREKRDRFGAALASICLAWQGEPVAWDGAGADAQPVTLAPLPVQKPHPPLWVAAFGPKALDQAGHMGLPYLASPVEPLAQLEQNYARHRAVLVSAGHAAGGAVPVMRTVFASRSAPLLERARALLAEQALATARLRSPGLQRALAGDLASAPIVGEPEQVVEAVARHREALGMTHLIVRAHVPELDARELETSLELLAASGLVARD